MKNVHIFEKVCCGGSSSTDLTGFLQKKFGDEVDVKTFDLGTATGTLPIPASLLFKIQTDGAGCLPALVVDGVVVSEGRLPNYLEAVELVQSGKAIRTAEPAQKKSGCC
jgi:hypothetical protein